MEWKAFELERWLLNPSEHDLGGAGITKLRLKDLAPSMDPDMVLGYGITNGSATLRAEVSRLFGVDPSCVLITTGTAEANFLALLRLVEPGDELIAFVPAYMQGVGIAQGLRARVRLSQLVEEEGYKVNLHDLRMLVNDKTKVISLVNPNNPTGAIVSESELRSICEMAARVGAWVLCDGALRGLERAGGQAATPVTLYERGIATGSISKIGLTGPRIGWLVGPQQLVDACWSYKDYTTLSHSGIGEYLATVALNESNLARILRRAKDRIEEHAAVLSEWVAKQYPLIEWVTPKAGHTAFLKYRLSVDSVTICRTLLKEEGVLISPGDYFLSPKHLRLGYSGERENLTQSLAHLSAFLQRNQDEWS